MTEINPLTPKIVNDSTSLQDNKGGVKKDIKIPLVQSDDEKQREEEINKNVIEQLNKKISETLKKLEKENNIKRTEKVITKLTAEKGGKISEEDKRYWAELINQNADGTRINPALLAALIARETGFEKNKNVPTGAGPMQVTTITVTDMFSDTKGGRKRLYDLIDKETLDKILYQTDKDGKPLVDKNGKPVRKYNSPVELRQACGKDDDLGIKVGIMCLKMKFAESIARSRGMSLENTIKGLKSGTIKLGQEELEEKIITTLKNYNSVFNDYAPAVIDSLKKSSNMPIDSFNLYRIPLKK